jgi:hypothetical protein
MVKTRLRAKTVGLLLYLQHQTSTTTPHKGAERIELRILKDIGYLNSNAPTLLSAAPSESQQGCRTITVRTWEWHEADVFTAAHSRCRNRASAATTLAVRAAS